MLELRREIMVLKLDLLITGDRVIENFIDVKNIELKELLNEMKGGTVEEVTAYVEKYLGFKLNLKECSVKQFYTYLEMIKKEAQKPILTNGK
jgi:hypothetical protein